MKAFEKPLSVSEEKYYLDLFQDGDKKAKEVLIERNLRLVVHMVKKYMYSDYELEDLISIGTIGLIKAINTFDYKKGSRLATYAAKCIDNELLMTFRCEKKRAREISLNEPFGTDKEGNEICINDVSFVEDEDVVEKIQKINDILKINEIFSKVLTKREQTILMYRYGLGNKEPLTQRELAKCFNISRSYVSRIEKHALEKLRISFGQLGNK